jgi:beta-glucosidase
MKTKTFTINSIKLMLILLCSCSTNKNDYLNPNIPVAKRVESLLDQMTLDEKIGQMCQYVGDGVMKNINNEDEKIKYKLGIGERAKLIKEGKIGSFLKVPTYKEANFLQEIALESRLKIPLLIATDAIHGHGMYMNPTTIYPTQINLASSFCPNLAKELAKATAKEMRATGYHWAFSPNIEIVRDARWGRTGESFGEDPYLVTEMGKAMIKGYQGEKMDKPINVMACAKHFVAGGIAYNGLNGAPADISERSLYETFFPPFFDAIKQNVFSIMPAHNEINGIPCHAHKEYLTNLLRYKKKFLGLYVSDWTDIEKLHSVHKIAENEKNADEIAVNAGLDIHMHGPNFFENIKASVLEGKISEERINQSAQRILEAKFKLGLFENRFVKKEEIDKVVLSPKHKNLALEIARKSIVLLENKNCLPLKKDLKLFLTGTNINNQSMLGDWARLQPDENITTVLEGFQQMSKPNNLDYLEINNYSNISKNIIQQAKHKASQADIAIVVVGENSIRSNRKKTSGENLDRATLGLAGNQLELVKSVHSSGKPTIVVYINGAPICEEWISENCAALVEAWEPGMFGGQAIAEIIYGEVNPSGKLPISFPRSSGHSQYFYNHKPSSFHRGRFYKAKSTPLYKFGHGLSYSKFEYSKLKVQKEKSTVLVKFIIKNNSKIDGDETALIYLTDKFSSVTTPVKKLVAFKRETILAGESKQIEISVPIESFKLIDKNMNRVLESGDFQICIGDDLLQTNLKM